MKRWLMKKEQLVEWELAGETEVLGGDPPQFPFVHHKSQNIWPGIEPGSQSWETGE
jgi:hypothetical protein